MKRAQEPVRQSRGLQRNCRYSPVNRGTLSCSLKVPLFTGEYPAVPLEAAALPYRLQRVFHAIPIHTEGKVLSLVMADPLDIETQNTVRLRTSMSLKIFMALEGEIQDQLDRMYGEEVGTNEKLIETLGDAFAGDDENIEHLRDLASEVPVIRLVNLIISRAVESRSKRHSYRTFRERASFALPRRWGSA